MPTFPSPVGPGLQQERTDQGVDFGGSGPVLAVGPGTIVSITGQGGWPGLDTFIGLLLDNPPDPQSKEIYYAEDIMPSVTLGEHVNTGQVLGQATGGSTGIEIGIANPNTTQPLNQVLYGPYTDNGTTPIGQKFADQIGNQSIGPVTPPAPGTTQTSTSGTKPSGPQINLGGIGGIFQALDKFLNPPSANKLLSLVTLGAADIPGLVFMIVDRGILTLLFGGIAVIGLTKLVGSHNVQSFGQLGAGAMALAA